MILSNYVFEINESLLREGELLHLIGVKRLLLESGILLLMVGGAGRVISLGDGSGNHRISLRAWLFCLIGARWVSFCPPAAVLI
ncbi:MAG TPA: hypothetical protein DDW68_01505 [Verrucomicrobiales bacterium]|nr:hypothetical protein [Verrucomicrobiales bacterium]